MCVNDTDQCCQKEQVSVLQIKILTNLVLFNMMKKHILNKIQSWRNIFLTHVPPRFQKPEALDMKLQAWKTRYPLSFLAKSRRNVDFQLGWRLFLRKRHKKWNLWNWRTWKRMISITVAHTICESRATPFLEIIQWENVHIMQFLSLLPRKLWPHYFCKFFNKFQLHKSSDFLGSSLQCSHLGGDKKK